MFVKLKAEKGKAVYFDTVNLKKYDVEIGHLYDAIGGCYDMNIIIAWETSYDENGKEIDDIHPVHILDYFMGETDDIEEAIANLKFYQEHQGKAYPIKF